MKSAYRSGPQQTGSSKALIYAIHKPFKARRMLRSWRSIFTLWRRLKRHKSTFQRDVLTSGLDLVLAVFSLASGRYSILAIVSAVVAVEWIVNFFAARQRWTNYVKPRRDRLRQHVGLPVSQMDIS